MAEEKNHQIGKVIVYGGRLSFASIYEPNRQKNDDGEERQNWKCNLLFDKKKLKEGGYKAKFNGVKMELKEALRKAGDEALLKKYPGGPASWPKYKPEKVYFRDGDLEDWDGYAGQMYISANAQLADKPLVITNRKDGNGNWIAATPGGPNSPYSGCYVNATLVIWIQDNENGKRKNAQVKAIQFVADGEAFGATKTDPNEDFDDDDVGEVGDLGDDDEDDDDSMV
jgi:hypothetical protein